MCEISSFYHLCGHLNKSKTHFCSACIHVRIEQQTYNSEQSRMKRPLALCDPSPLHTYLIPTLCDSCNTNSEVKEYLEKDPTATFEIFRSWKASLRLENVKAIEEAEGRAAWRRCAHEEDSDDSSSAESMPFVSASGVSSSASATSARTSFVYLVDDEREVKPPKSLEDTSETIAVLKGRVVKAVASITH